jgi:glycosyltransferase involved in cell wall biosynthesis
MAENLARRFGKESLLLLPTADVAEFQICRALRERAPDALTIVYTGAIYGMQQDALQRLVRIVTCGVGETWTPSKVKLILYTSAPARYLRKIGFSWGPSVYLDEVKHEAMPSVLAEADILFLPMSFDPQRRHMVTTSIPSKISEYLASGVPILAHGPEYSSAVRYCREHNCALVVDQPDDAALREALIRLAADDELRRRLSEKALQTANKNHDAREIVPKFLVELCAAQRESD